MTGAPLPFLDELRSCIEARQVDGQGQFDISAEPEGARLSGYGFVSGTSNHADRLAIIRRVWQDYGVMIDTHTADGVKVGLEHRDPGVPLICLETALPAKFAETIREALGRDPERPAGYENIEQRAQHVEVMAADAVAVKRFIEAHCA